MTVLQGLRILSRYFRQTIFPLVGSVAILVVVMGMPIGGAWHLGRLILQDYADREAAADAREYRVVVETDSGPVAFATSGTPEIHPKLPEIRFREKATGASVFLHRYRGQGVKIDRVR